MVHQPCVFHYESYTRQPVSVHQVSSCTWGEKDPGFEISPWLNAVADSHAVPNRKCCYRLIGEVGLASQNPFAMDIPQAGIKQYQAEERNDHKVSRDRQGVFTQDGAIQDISSIGQGEKIR